MRLYRSKWVQSITVSDIQDNYEKIVLTLDRFLLGNYDGIKVVNVIAWLLG